MDGGIYKFFDQKSMYIYDQEQLEFKKNDVDFTYMTTTKPMVHFKSKKQLSLNTNYIVEYVETVDQIDMFSVKGQKEGLYSLDCQLLGQIGKTMYHQDIYKIMAKGVQNPTDELEKTVRLSEYDPKLTYDTLIVDISDSIKLNQTFNKIIYLKENRNININKCPNIVIQYSPNNIGWLPKTITHLTIGDRDKKISFNLPIENFPELVELSINSNNFNDRIKKLNKLVVLDISSDIFDRAIGFLPNLEKLTIDSKFFNKPIKISVILKELTIFSARFNHPINHFSRLTHLDINSTVFNQSINNLSNLIQAEIRSENFNMMIEGMKNLIKLLIQSDHFNQPIIIKSLENLDIICHKFNKPISDLPNITSVLIESKLFNQPITNLPQIRELSVYSSKFDQPIDLPSLKIFNITADNFDRPLSQLINLEELNIISNKFKQDLSNLNKLKIKLIKKGSY